MAMSRQLGFSPGETDTDAPASHFSRQQQQQMMAAMKGSSSSSMSSTAAHEPFVARSDSRLHDAAARGVCARARVCVRVCVCVYRWGCGCVLSNGPARVCFAFASSSVVSSCVFPFFSPLRPAQMRPTKSLSSSTRSVIVEATSSHSS